MENKGKKQKGDNFERLIARQIGEWWEGDKDSFWRTSGSGSRAHRDDIHPGDIGPVKNLKTLFPFCIECRNRESWTIDEIFKSSVPDLLVWTVENIDVAGPNYLSLIIAKRKYNPPLAVFPNWERENLGNIPHPSLRLHLGGYYSSVIIMPLENFFELYTSDWFNTSHASTRVKRWKTEERGVKKDIEKYLASIKKK